MNQKELNEIFKYENGNLYWNISKKGIKKGNKAGCLNKSGYRIIRINQKTYFAHRIIFMMFHGYMPNQLDHINGIKNDNRIENLRIATHGQNQQNRGMFKNNSTGVKNVTFERGKWRVKLGINGKNKHFGYYFDINVAKFVAEMIRNKYYGNFARNV